MRLTARLALTALLLTGCAAAPPPPSPEPGEERIAFMPAPQFGDLDPFDWTGRSPAHYLVHGIDVSRYQGQIDWRTARGAGVQFAYLKATEGGDLADPMFHDYRRGARRAGVRWGAYHFFYWCRPAAEQARWFIRHVPRDAHALPHVLDLEWNHRSPTCTDRPDARKVRAEARRFLSILEEHYGRRPIVYTTPDFFRDSDIGRLSGTEFWLRSTAGHPGDTYPRQHWRIWQYSGTGQVPGIEGPVDLNAFGGSVQDWLAWSQ